MNINHYYQRKSAIFGIALMGRTQDFQVTSQKKEVLESSTSQVDELKNENERFKNLLAEIMLNFQILRAA